MLPVVLALVVAALIAVVSLLWQGAWFVVLRPPPGISQDVARSELRQRIADCREAVLTADPDTPHRDLDAMRAACEALDRNYRDRFGEAP